jgi:hypothetical protein
MDITLNIEMLDFLWWSCIFIFLFCVFVPFCKWMKVNLEKGIKTEKRSVEKEKYEKAANRVVYQATVMSRAYCADILSSPSMPSQQVNLKLKSIREMMEAVHNIPLFLNNWKEGKEEDIIKFLALHDAHNEYKLLDVWNQALGLK